MNIKPLVIQPNKGAYEDAVLEHTPALKSNFLEGHVTMNIKVYCSCGQPVEVSSNAGGHRFNCPSCGRELTVPKIEMQEANRHADAASPKVFIRFENFYKSFKSNWEINLWLFGAVATIIGAICVTLALLTK